MTRYPSLEPDARWGLVGARDEARPVRSPPGAYQRYYAAIVASLQHGAPPPVDPDDAVTVLEISARQRSAATHETVARAPRPG